MVHFHDTNYLLTAVATRKHILTTCLVTVPKHEDKSVSLAHQSHFIQEHYRSPWKNGKVDETLLTHEVQNISKSAAQLTSTVLHEPKLELFESKKTNDANPCEETATFDCNFVIIPDSPCSDTNETLVDLTSNSTLELVVKENLENFRAVKEELKLEPVLLKDETIQDIITDRSKGLLSLVQRLREEPVSDPLAICSHFAALEPYICCKEEKQSNGQNGEQSSSIFHEEFQKFDIYPTTQELENIIVKEELTVQLTQYMNVCVKSATIPKIPLEIDQDISVKDIIAKSFPKQQQPELILEAPKPVPDTYKQLTFLEINDCADEEVDTFCDTAILDSPVETCSLELYNIKTKKKALALSPLQSSQSQICLLDDQEKQVLEENCLTSEYLRDPKQSARLPVPNVAEIQIGIDRHSLVQDIFKTFRLSADRGIGKLELDLSWTLVQYSDIAVNQLEKLPGKSCHEKESKSGREPVISCQKYKAEEMKAQDETANRENDPKISNASQHEPDNPSCKVKESTKPVIKAKVLVKERSSDFDFDPLGDFMALRSKVKETTSVVAEHCNEPIPNPAKETEDNPMQVKLKPGGRRGNKHHVVNVQLTEEFEGVIDMLEESAAPYLQQLKQSGDLAPATTFSTLTPDSALFMVKQKEKNITDSNGKCVSVDSYRATVCLYALSQAAEFASCSCLESAVSFLSAVLEEYQVVKNTALVSVLKKLVDKLTEFSRSQVSHPKVLALCQEIETWLKKKRAKTGDNEQKILVLVRGEMSSLSNCLKSSLSCGSLLTPDILNTSDSEKIIQSLDSHNCLITHHRYVQDTFPWAQFCLVVEYEFTEGSEWQTICQRQNIRHIGIQQQPTHTLKKKPMSTNWIPSVIDHQIIILASSDKIISNTELLQLLEGKHNMLLIERDYPRLVGHNNLVFADLDIDERSCIILADLKDLQDDCGIQNIIKRLMVMSLKYTKCFCILTSIKKDNRYELPGPVITNLSRLKATVANMHGRLPDFLIKIVQCSSTSELASVIRCISEQCKPESGSPELTQKWLDRPWIRQDVTKEEQFLLTIPCLSSYNAQLMLNSQSVKKLLKMISSDLATIFPNIPERLIKTFVSYTNSIRGLQLQRSEDSEDISKVCVTDTENTDQVAVPDNLNKPESEGNVVEHNSESLDFGENDAFEDVLRKQRYHRKMLGKQNETKESAKSYQSHMLKEVNLDPELDARPSSVSGRKYMTESGDHAKNLTLSNKLNIMRENSTANPSGGFYHKSRENDFEPYFNQRSRSQYHSQRNLHEDAEKEQNTCTDKSTISKPRNMVDFITDDNLSIDQAPYRRRLAPTQTKQLADTYIIQRPHYREDPEPVYSGMSLPIQTFDYNHGLSYKTTPSEQSVTQSLSKQAEYSRPNVQQFNMAQLAREFPTAEELDAQDYIPGQSDLDIDANLKYSVRQQQNKECIDYSLKDMHSVHEDAYTTQPHNEVDPEQTKSVGFNLQPIYNRDDDLDNSSFDLLAERYPCQTKVATNTYKPLRNTEDKENAPPSQRGQYTSLYLNPNLDRVSLRANFLKQPEIEKQSSNNEQHSNFNWSLANDLRETTRRFLENSQQFSKLGTPNSRRPPLRVNIGLAQPLPRQNQVNNTGSMYGNKVRAELDVPTGESTERQLMEQSMWTTEGSPPMDLEDDHCPTYNTDTINREVFSYQTPKKRKLTYQRAPGRKGQTTLVFS